MTIKDYTNEEQQYMQYIEDKAYIDPNKEVKYPPIAISMGNFRAGSEIYPIPIGTYGNFSLAGIGLASVVGVILNLVLPKTSSPIKGSHIEE